MKQDEYNVCNKNQNSVYKLVYELTLITKNANECLDDKIVEIIKNTIKGFNKDYGLKIIDTKYKSNYIKITFSTNPNINIQKLVNSIKSSTPKTIRRDYPDLKEDLKKGSFWDRGYIIRTRGNIEDSFYEGYVKEKILKISKDKDKDN